jgi:hypothetical protein
MPRKSLIQFVEARKQLDQAIVETGRIKTFPDFAES